MTHSKSAARTAINTPADSTTSAGQASWRDHAGELSLPTLTLLAIVLIGEGWLWTATLIADLPLWLGAIVATLLAYLAFTVMHEASHGNVHGFQSRWRWLSNTAGWLSGFWLLAAYPAFRVVHLQHHAHTNHEHDDPDRWVAGSNPLSIAMRCATILPHYYRWFLFGAGKHTRAARDARRATIAGTLAMAAVFGVLVFAGLALEALVLWAGPALLATAVLAFLFDWLPHYPHQARERYHDTRILLLPGASLAMMWQNFHLIHHLYPRVPFYRYGSCFRALRHELETHGATIEGFERDRDLPLPLSAAGRKE